MNSRTDASLQTAAPLTSAQAAARELLARRAALDSLSAFVRYMREHGCDSRYFEHDPHLTQSPLIRIAEELVIGNTKAATVSCPPSFSKSTVFSIWLPCWALARDPRLRIIWCTHTDSLVQLFARERRNILNSSAWQALAGTSLTDANMAADTLQLQHGGSIISRSAGASVTGLRGDLILADDLVSGSDEARSRPMLEGLHAWMLNDLLSRRDNAGSRFAVIGTRWSVLDPIGRLVQLTEAGALACEHVRIPMVCDDPAKDPLGRTCGGWIDWPGRFDDEEQRRIWQRSTFTWQTLYQQRPYDAVGGFASPDDIRIVSTLPVGTSVIGGDFAMTDSSKADYTVFAAGTVYLNERGEKALCVTDLWRQQRNARDVAEAFVELVRIHRPYAFACERDGASRVYLDSAIPGECRRRSVSMPYTIRLPTAGASKEVKASPLRGLIQRGLVSFVKASWNAEVLDEFVRFPSGEHDDAVDAIAAIARIFDKLSAPNPPRVPESRHLPTGVVMQDGRPHYAVSFEDLWEDHTRDARWRRDRIE